MGDESNGLIVVFALIFIAFLLIQIGRHGGPALWFIFGNAGLLIILSVLFGIAIAILLMLAKE